MVCIVFRKESEALIINSRQIFSGLCQVDKSLTSDSTVLVPFHYSLLIFHVTSNYFQICSNICSHDLQLEALRFPDCIVVSSAVILITTFPYISHWTDTFSPMVLL